MVFLPMLLSTFSFWLNNLESENSKYRDYDSIKKQLDDINKANMTEQEKLEEQKKEIEKNILQEI